MIRKNTSSQLELFAHPFDKKLDTQNRWVLLADKFPWEELSKFYIEKMSVDMGSPGKESRMVLGAAVLMNDLFGGCDDRDGQSPGGFGWSSPSPR